MSDHPTLAIGATGLQGGVERRWERRFTTLKESTAMNQAPAATRQIAEQIQCLDTKTLVAAARGEIDLVMLFRQELAARGMSQQGAWVGFARAAEEAAAA